MARVANIGGFVSDICPGLIIIPPGQLIVVHSVFLSDSVNSTKELKSSSPLSMIVQAVSDETLITTRKYVLMIVTAAILTYFFMYIVVFTSSFRGVLIIPL